MIDRCVMCGEIVPEGRQVCPNCEHQDRPRLKVIITLRNGTTVTAYPVDYFELGSLLAKLDWKKVKAGT